MKAILLAAGRGVRLHPYTDTRPKCMVEVGGKPLIDTNMENLAKIGVEQVVVVVGYRGEMIEEYLAKRFPPHFYKIIRNEDYTRGSGSSLICATEEMQGEILTVESDLLYDVKVIEQLCGIKDSNAITLGHFNHGRKEVKIYLRQDGDIDHCAWGTPDDPAAGDWVGFCHLLPKASADLQNILRQTSPDQGKEISYEFFVFEVMKNHRFRAVDISEFSWIEIDNEEDLLRARNEVYPKMQENAKS